MPKHFTPICRILAAALIAFGVLLASNDARADFWGWVTDLVTQPSEHPEEVSLGRMALPPDAIVTAPGEVRIIELGRDVLELNPSTAVTIKTTTGNVTTVQVITGTVRAKVVKRRSQSFKVETRMLVATVKGTVFEVSTTDAASAVSVYEGRVAVKANGGIGGVDVTPGKTATVTDAHREPSLGRTPEGGAAAAAKALSRMGRLSAIDPTDDQFDENNKGSDRPRTLSRSDRAPSGNGPRSGGNGTGGGTGGGNSGGGDDGGEDGEGDDGEGADDDD